MSHPIVHLELAAHDPAASGKFYADVFGWEIKVDPNFDYYQFAAEGGPGGGFNKVDENNKAGEVIPYLGVEDIDAALEKVNAAGGKTMVPKTEIPGIGWFAQFTDPGGNRIGLFAGPQPQG
jgi:predicted enzyme related to lactoylglutathione lyase